MVTVKGIDWRSWGEGAFSEAAEAGKPILLSIGAVWCHWCHVMDRTSYSDPNVVQMINDRFIPIRVDTDKRPEVNSRYNLGGWPTTAFLTPGGDLMTGGTYLPPENLKPILKKVSDYFRENRKEIEERVARLKFEVVERGEEENPIEGALLSYEIVRGVLESLRRAYDRELGGFGREPKFPHARALELALAWYRRTGDRETLEIAAKTLQMMAGGGMYDDQAGGFFRYSTTRDWSIPHFEKMLEDNALLLRNYLTAYQVTGEDQYLGVARSVIGYIDSTLSDPKTGAFFGSQDADEEYYALALADRTGRQAPYIDRTLYTDWNSMMVISYLRASEVLGEPRLRDRALKALDYLLKECWTETTGAYHFHASGKSEHPGLLNDQVWLARALVEAHLLVETSGRPHYLEAARSLCGLIERDHWDDERGGFYDTSGRIEAIGALREKQKPFEENANAADLMLVMYQLGGDQRHRDLAEKTLVAFRRAYRRYDVISAAYALAVDRLLQPLKITISGPADRAETLALFNLARSAYLPGGLVNLEDEPGQSLAAMICTHEACLPPVSTPVELKGQMDRLVRVGT